MRKIILVTVFILSIFSTFAQTNFKMEMRKANPTKEDPTIPIEKKIQLHKDFLQKAIVEKNEKNQLFGHFYLLVDYYKIQDYVAVNKCLLDAEIIVNKSKNLSWKGAFAMRKSLVLDLKDDKQGVLKQYQLAFEFCRQAKDSLCMAESLEQISTTYGELDNLVKADEYFKKALPLLEKFADSQQMALTYNNYSNLLSYKKDYSEAINYSEKAIVIAQNSKDTYKEMMYQNNKASLLTDLKKYDEAESLFKDCEAINLKNKWGDRLIQNYLGLSVLYETKKDFENAHYYLREFYWIKDSLTGEEIKTKMADMEVRYKTQNKELALNKSQLNLLDAERKIDRKNWIIALTILTIGFGAWYWKKQNTRAKKELLANKENLKNLTNLIIQKNALLLTMEDEVNIKNGAKEIGLDELQTALYNQRILTDSDWASFKTYFEKVYPNYISRLRNTHPTITESEERLFLCIKINLRTKETASMLGISNDSVKKNRSRLRKRLLLEAEQDLVDYIQLF